MTDTNEEEVQVETNDEQSDSDHPVERAAVKDSWPDRWWVWALGGFAFAGFFGLLHILT